MGKLIDKILYYISKEHQCIRIHEHIDNNFVHLINSSNQLMFVYFDFLVPSKNTFSVIFFIIINSFNDML